MLILTGATGNTGSLVAERLRKIWPSRRIVALVRSSSDTSSFAPLGIQPIECDLTQPDSYLPIIEPGATFIEMANLRHAKAMMPSIVQAGVTRAFCVTTTAVFSQHHSYAALYKEIESDLLAAPIPVTLLRPSMIYGNARDHNMHKLLALLKRTPIFPIFGSGTALMQPVYVEDLADGIVRAIVRDAKGAYNLTGPEPISYKALLGFACSALERDVKLVSVNHRLAAALVSCLQFITRFPVKTEQVIRLLEDKSFDISTSVKELGYAPRSFSEGIRLEVASLNAMSKV